MNQRHLPAKIGKVEFPHTPREEFVNAITHGIAALLSFVGLLLLLSAARQTGDLYRLIGVGIFGICLTSLYTASTIYHAYQRPKVRRSLRKIFLTLDHVNIFFAIAGTYTPFLLIHLRGMGGWTGLITIWMIAGLGAFIKIFYTGRFNLLTTSFYLMMGWMSLLVIGPLSQTMAQGSLSWLLFGGLSYTLGIIPYFWNTLPYNHAVWHLFVMAGSLFHYLGIYLHVL